MAVVKRKLPEAPPSVKAAIKTKKAIAEFKLPTTASVPSTDMGDYSMLLFGDKKIGKTSLAAEFPNALFLMTEPGAKALSVYQTPITEWEQAKAAVAALASDTRFKTVVVDTVDLAFKLCEKSACARLGIEHPSEEDWGKGWAAVRDEFTRWATQLMGLGKGVIFISHAVEREIKTRSGAKYDRFQPTMPGQARDVIEGMVDVWAYYTYDDKTRMLTLRGDEHVMAGHRLQKNFRWDGREVRQIHMGTSAAQAYGRLMRAFRNEYNPDDPTAGETKKSKK